MNRTGYDAFVLEDASNETLWVEISDQKVAFPDAKDLWGKGTYQMGGEMLKRVGVKGAGALVIDPARENLGRFAVIENDY